MSMFSRFNRVSRRRLIALSVLLMVTLAISIAYPAFADNPSGCDFSPANNGTPGCLPPLTGSTFAGGDGNLMASPTTYGTTDWQNVAGLNPGFDLASGSGDNSFGQGTKEDNPNVTVVTGSIPPNKSDLTRFYEASEIGSNGHNFLYLAWERSNVLGTANMDFEINQKTTAGLSASFTGAITLNRTAGDLLVTYDFSNGGGRPAVGLLRWLTSATVPVVTGFSTNACFSSSTFPCWGDQVTLNGTDSIGAVNNLDSVTDPLFPGSANYINPLPALQFGETAIDLTAAGVFPAGTCEAFGSAFVKSRSSTSFTAEVKDFIAPIPVNISNCGEIKIIKQTDPRGLNQVFQFTSASQPLPANSAAGGVICPGDTTAGVQADGSFCLNDNGNTTQNNTANTVDEKALQPATYTVQEHVPGGYTFESLTCTVTSGSGPAPSTSSTTASISLTAGESVTCVYVNKQDSSVMTTQVSTTAAVFPGVAVNDTATVTGNIAADIPSGTVTFYMCAVNSGACVSGGTNIGTGTLSPTGQAGQASAPSPNVNSPTGLAAGSYCFRAEWPGDLNYPGGDIEYGGPNGTNECFTVQQIPTTTTTTPSAGSGGTVTYGTATVTDTALVQATQSGDGNPTGTVTFYLCDPTQLTGGVCSTGGTQIGSPVDLQPVANVTPPESTATSSAAPALDQTGTWCWRSVFTPGGANGSNYTGSVDSDAAGECFTVNDTSSSSSAQTWLPNDSATIASLHGAPLNGTLSIQLYTDGTCGTSGGSAVSGQLYSQTLTNAGSTTLNTSNTTYMVSVSATVSWGVTFTSTDPNVAGSNHCESTGLTITN